DVAVLNVTNVDVEAFGQVYSSNVSAAFVAGVVTAGVGCIGVLMMVDGWRRARVRRSTRRAEHEERDRLADERRRELDRQAELAGGRSTYDDRDTADVDLRDRETAGARRTTDDSGERR